MAKKQEAIETISINGVDYVKADAIPQPKELSDRVLVRCLNAGVHVGTIVEQTATTLTLENANRLWRWRGAFTLSEVAMDGVNRKEYTRIAKMLPRITLILSDVCEIIPVAKGVDLTECDNG